MHVTPSRAPTPGRGNPPACHHPTPLKLSTLGRYWRGLPPTAQAQWMAWRDAHSEGDYISRATADVHTTEQDTSAAVITMARCSHNCRFGVLSWCRIVVLLSCRPCLFSQPCWRQDERRADCVRRISDVAREAFAIRPPSFA